MSSYFFRIFLKKLLILIKKRIYLLCTTHKYKDTLKYNTDNYHKPQWKEK